MRRALVFGGSGEVGSHVVRRLAAAGVQTVFTYHRAKDRAEALALELGQKAAAIDLREREAVRALVRQFDQEGQDGRDGQGSTIFVHCAGVLKDLPLAEITDTSWRDAVLVNAEAAFLAVQELAPVMARQRTGQVVFVGALDRSQSVPMPVHVAASQGMLSAMTMALAKELGPSGICVNMVALGLLAHGAQRLSPKLVSDYQRFSALRRVGTAEEAARAIAWLALENSYMSGKVLAVNGGV